MSFSHNEPMRKKLYDYIKEKINTGELQPGTPINQKKIFAELGISRTPYRDCMIQLEAEGLVKIIPCKGVVIREFSISEIMEIQEIGAALEGMAYELAFHSSQKKCIPILSEIISKAEAAFIRNEAPSHELNMKFHTVVLAQCPNKMIVEKITKMRERIYDFPRHDLIPLLKWEKIFWQEHLNIVEILKHGTPQELGEYIRSVHWNVKGKEGYWESLLSVEPGTVKKYFAERNYDDI